MFSIHRHNLQLALTHGQSLRPWISGTQPNLEYDNNDDTKTVLNVFKDYNEIRACYQLEQLDDILETFEMVEKIITSSKRNMQLIFHAPQLFDEFLWGEIPNRFHGFIINHETKSIQYGYHSFGIRYDHHFTNGVRQREIMFTAQSYDTIKNISQRLCRCDKLMDLITPETTIQFVGIQENKHCHFPSDPDMFTVADLWSPMIILIFSNTLLSIH